MSGDYDEKSPEEDNEENTNGDSDKESGSEEGIGKDESSSDEEEKDWDHIFPVLFILLDVIGHLSHVCVCSVTPRILTKF